MHNHRLTYGTVVLILLISSGCTSLFHSNLAHTVNVYEENSGDGEHDSRVVVLVEDSRGNIVYNRTYRFDEQDSADESGAFPAEADPKKVIVKVDGETVTFDWPTPNCGEQTRSGVEIVVSPGGNDPVSVDGRCETETVEKRS